MVDWDGLENRCAGNRTVGSNPTLSANYSYMVFLTVHFALTAGGAAPNVVSTDVWPYSVLRVLAGHPAQVSVAWIGMETTRIPFA